MYSPSFFRFPYTKVTLSLANCLYLTSRFSNCMQKPVMSARLCWDLGFKKPRLIVLKLNKVHNITTKCGQV